WLIKDKNDKIIGLEDSDPNDKRVIGNGIPRYRASWSNHLTYKRWDLDILMRGAFKFDILDLRAAYFRMPVHINKGQSNIMHGTFDKIDGKEISIEQPVNLVSYFLEKGAFWKIDRIN